jgi:HAD superfamily hydrolase (TIGR01509 family)
MKLVFDFGGVVFRWRPHELLSRTLPHRAGDASMAAALAADVFQHPAGEWAEFDRGTVEPAALARRIATRIGMSVAEVLKVIDAVPDELQPQLATVELMGRLRAAGHQLFYLSNMPAPYAGQLEQAHDFMRWFDDGVFSSRVHLIKPEPAIFHEAERRFGPARELLFIDDHPANVEAARAQGWQALRFISAEQCAAELAARGLLSD